MNRKAVHLRFGQRIGALQLDWILRRQHEEGRHQGISGAEDRDLMLLHRLQHRRLSLGGGAVDLVAEHDMGKDWPGLELELPVAVDLVQKLGPGDVRRHQVGRELDPFEAQRQRLAGGLDHQGLAQTGHAFNQHVAAAKQGGQDLSDHRLMAHDHAADFALDPVENFTKLGHPIFGPGCLWSGSHRFSLRLSPGGGYLSRSR